MNTENKEQKAILDNKGLIDRKYIFNQIKQVINRKLARRDAALNIGISEREVYSLLKIYTEKGPN